MTRRSASLVQADYDRAVSALAKAGHTPEIIFDVIEGKVTIKPANLSSPVLSSWQEGAPDRV